MNLKNSILLIAVALVTAPLAGCIGDEGEEVGGGDIESVAIVSAPEVADPDAEVEACWRVEGSGTIQSTALGYGYQAQLDPESLAAYDGGILYPGGEAEPAQEGYELPGEFCATVPVPEKGAVFMRAGAAVGELTTGQLSAEHVVRVTDPLGSPYPIVVRAPNEAAANETVTVCWAIDGEQTINATGVVWDTESHNVENVTLEAYVEGPIYPDNATEPAAEGYDLPGTFCTGIPMPADAESIYFRAWNTLPGTEREALSLERAIAVT